MKRPGMNHEVQSQRPALHLNHLKVCAPAPSAHDLKTLGILRLIAEQKDPAVRAHGKTSISIY